MYAKCARAIAMTSLLIRSAPAGRLPRLVISGISGWISALAYMPKLRGRMVSDTSIREAACLRP